MQMAKTSDAAKMIILIGEEPLPLMIPLNSHNPARKASLAPTSASIHTA